MALVYLPHLDYDHQRFGPESPESVKAAQELDEVLGDLIDHCRTRGDQIVVLSEYGITEAHRPVEINRALRRAGFLNVYTQAGMEYLDPWTSRAFCVSDHQIGHVYVPNAGRHPRRARDARRARRRGEILEGESLAAAGLNHERSGELVVLAERDAWFTYHYWLDNARAPDFGQQVEIHRKPGYDPAELLWDPDDEKGAEDPRREGARAQEGGFRYVLSVVGLDASKYVKGTHGLHARQATRTARCSCAASPRTRVTEWRPPTSATCCWTWPASPKPSRADSAPVRRAAHRPRARPTRRISGQAGLDRAIHGLGREHVLDDHDRRADRRRRGRPGGRGRSAGRPSPGAASAGR